MTPQVIDIKLPTCWSALSEKELRYVYRLVAYGYNADAVKTRCLLRWARMKFRYRDSKKVFVCILDGNEYRVSAESIAECLAALEWMETPSPVPVALPRIGRHRAFPADMARVPLETYLICDNLFQGYLQTRSEKCLTDMASLLYGHRFSRLKPGETISVFYWYASLKTYMVNRWPNLFLQSADSNLLGAPTALSARQIQSNVDTIIRALTKGDVTKEKEILALDTHRALTELDAQAREYREINSKIHSK